MARIRTIKPEFFTSADILELTPLARLFYVSLWCEADREGRLNWSPKTLKYRYMPGDDVAVEDLAAELVDHGLIVIYEVDGRDYAEIPTFKNHQVINNRESDSVIAPRVKVASPRVSAEGREGRKGKEGKEDASPDVLAILIHLNQKTGRNYKPVKANISLITARLADGATRDECCAVIDAKVDAWNGDAKMREYLRPETLFGATKFAGYVGQLSNSGGSAEKDYL